MSEIDDLTEKINLELSEDDIIKEIMLEYPDLYDLMNFTEFSISDSLEKNGWWYLQFRELWVKERHKLRRIEILMDEYIGNLYHELRFENNIKLGKLEVENYYLKKDEKAIKYKKLYMRQQIRVEVFEAIKDAFKQQGFNMNVFQKNLVA